MGLNVLIFRGLEKCESLYFLPSKSVGRFGEMVQNVNRVLVLFASLFELFVSSRVKC